MLRNCWFFEKSRVRSKLNNKNRNNIARSIEINKLGKTKNDTSETIQRATVGRCRRKVTIKRVSRSSITFWEIVLVL